MQKEAESLQGCTFEPQIRRRPTSVGNGVPGDVGQCRSVASVVFRSAEMEARKKDRADRLRQELLDEEMSKCTFRPQMVTSKPRSSKSSRDCEEKGAFGFKAAFASRQPQEPRRTTVNSYAGLAAVAASSSSKSSVSSAPSGSVEAPIVASTSRVARDSGVASASAWPPASQELGPGAHWCSVSATPSQESQDGTIASPPTSPISTASSVLSFSPLEASAAAATPAPVHFERSCSAVASTAKRPVDSECGDASIKPRGALLRLGTWTSSGRTSGAGL